MSSHCAHLLLTIQLVCLCATSVVIACVQTGGAGSGVSVASQCSGTQPANTAGLVQATTSAEADYDGLPSGFCSCPSANAIDYIYPANTDNDIQNDAIYGPGIICADVTQLCVCDEQGNCYKAVGSLGNVALSATSNPEQVYFSSYCDGGGCHMYTTILCTTNQDPNSGLVNIVTGELFPCSAEFTMAGTLQPIGTGSPYIRAASVSCRGCVNNPTCSGTFTTLPQHAG